MKAAAAAVTGAAIGSPPEELTIEFGSTTFRPKVSCIEHVHVINPTLVAKMQAGMEETLDNQNPTR